MTESTIKSDEFILVSKLDFENLQKTSESTLDYKDIVNIDTYKNSFVKFLKLSQLSIWNQRALNRWREAELWGAFEEIWKLINIVQKIDILRQNFDDSKEREKEKKKQK